MAGSYDGSINIDTKIDEKGFNEGIRNVESSMKSTGGKLGQIFSKMSPQVQNILLKLMTVGVVISTVIIFALTAVVVILAAIVVIIQVIIGLIVAMAGAFVAFTEIMYKGMSQSSYLHSEFSAMHSLIQDLKSTILASFSPLWIVVEPVVTRIINWFIQLFNILQQVLAALFGQATYMQYVAGSAQKAEKSAGGAAKSHKESEKALKGALAAFDELNVLQQDVPEPEETGGAGGAGLGSLGEFVEMPVDERILEIVNNIKQWFIDAWTTISEFVTGVWDWIVEKAMIAWEFIKLYGGIAWDWIKEKALWVWDNVLKPVWAWLKETFAGVWDWIKEKAGLAWEWISETWGNIKDWFTENVLDPLRELWSGIWEMIKILANNAWVTIKFIWMTAAGWWMTNVITPIATFFRNLWEGIKVNAIAMWTGLKIVFGVIADWFNEHVVEPLKKYWEIGVEWLAGIWETTWEGIKSFVKGIINGIIDFFNWMMDFVAKGINLLIGVINTVGSFIPGWIQIPAVEAPTIPKLAAGGVIPPNAEFMAVLGDQRHGRNIEAPEDLLRQIVAEEAGANQAVTINFGGDLGELIRILKPYIDREDARVGSSLVEGLTG